MSDNKKGQIDAFQKHQEFIFKSLNKSKNTKSENKNTEFDIDVIFTTPESYTSPNSVLRSALFGLVEKGKRKYEKGVVKAALNGYTITYTGEQLDQSDFDVWLELLKRFSEGKSENIIFSFNSFLNSINRNTGKKDYLWLKGVLTRLQACSVEIKCKNITYQGTLVTRMIRDEKDSDVVQGVVLNKELFVLFSGKDWTLIDRNVRLSLKGKPLAQWLYSFYCTHKKPIPYSVEMIKSLCGSESSNIYSFKQTLKKNLDLMGSNTNWKCYINNNKVYVEK
ncbi:plasmid replication initiator TrfA [Proteus mirabilis]|uniref:plasmid replication initiator TrfA n=1 Tax=Proteus mirabilis TaxID=584 RepID=UPI000D86184B|nr:plasmid replication initiator TrfA [Proteus mirabilis]EMA4642791.1 replication initiator protein A [Proteus mirabilis]MBG5961671.1 replication initiator protein A [Proteus mirabilis]MBL1397234.1 replication initiator protein A [Proteus mirabilis]MBQ0656476.1 replication initiator protein A [Proteus mirabilis]MDL2104945.1 plasmid replication initiator TrfA [Proteus mirabilis]